MAARLKRGGGAVALTASFPPIPYDSNPVSLQLTASRRPPPLLHRAPPPQCTRPLRFRRDSRDAPPRSRWRMKLMPGCSRWGRGGGDEGEGGVGWIADGMEIRICPPACAQLRSLSGLSIEGERTYAWSSPGVNLHQNFQLWDGPNSFSNDSFTPSKLKIVEDTN